MDARKDNGMAPPPWPGEASPQLLFVRLGQLRDWINVQRGELEPHLGPCIPEVDDLPHRQAYLTQPVRMQYAHLCYMASLRQQWDQLTSMYAGAWDCQECLRWRAALVRHAALVLRSAFVPYEVREAMVQWEMEKSLGRTGGDQGGQDEFVWLIAEEVEGGDEQDKQDGEGGDQPPAGGVQPGA